MKGTSQTVQIQLFKLVNFSSISSIQGLQVAVTFPKINPKIFQLLNQFNNQHQIIRQTIRTIQIHVRATQGGENYQKQKGSQREKGALFIRLPQQKVILEYPRADFSLARNQSKRDWVEEREKNEEKSATDCLQK